MNFNKRYPLMKGDGGGGGGGGDSSTGPGVTSGDGSSVTSGDGSSVTSGNYGQVSGSNGMLGDPANVSPASPTDSGYSTGYGQDNNYSDYYSFSLQPSTEAPAVGPVAADAGEAGDASPNLSVDAKESAKDPSESQGLVSRIAVYNPNASLPSAETTPAQRESLASPGPLSFQRQSEITGISTADMNNAVGRPANYNPDNKSLADRAFDATNPTPGGALAKAGWRGLGMTANDTHNQESMNPGMREARNDSWGAVVNGVGSLAMNSVPGMGIIKAGADTINNIQAGQPVGVALTNAGKSILGGYIGSKINGAIGGVIGPNASNALSMYNKGATVVNAFGGDAPTVNPGGMVANAMLGKPSTKVSGAGGAGTTNMDGSHLPSPDWSSLGARIGSSGQGAAPQQVPQVSEPAATPMATADASLYGKASTASRTAAAKKYFSNKQSRGW